MRKVGRPLKGICEKHSQIRVIQKSGYSRCRSCHQECDRRINHKDHRREMLHQARRRAKQSGVPCTITKEDIKIPVYCPVLGIKLTAGTSGDCDAAPSLDRFNPALGYIPENIFVISKRANTLKNNGTIEEHKNVLEWMQRTEVEMQNTVRGFIDMDLPVEV
jgi:hypothetical protein